VNVSLTLARDWENLSADQALTDLWATITLDCYAREADTKEAVWIVEGTVNHTTVAQFVDALSIVVADYDIRRLCFSRV